jgi:hypothetical protein
MAELEKQATIATITKEAYDDPAISDFRKQTRSFAIIARGVTADDVAEVCGALMFDYLACVDRTLKREDQIIEREELFVQAKLRQQTALRLEERRARIERESGRGASVAPETEGASGR